MCGQAVISKLAGMSRSVLIVEDDAVLRRGLLALIRTGGHDAAGAASVAEAGSRLDAAAPTHVLLDLNLPDGTGTQVLRRIRAAGLPVRVALVTGTADDDLTREADALGVDAVFVKPPDWDQLLEWVDRA